jgi:23S rRNA pseudouridine2605 synthase
LPTSVPVRLNRLLAQAGVASRRAADELISDGRVTVNGLVAEVGARVDETDDVRVDGRPLTPERQVHLALHKPTGLITTASDPQGRRTVLDLVEVPERVYPVGRLDRDTTGLLLVTNDGELAHRLMHPRHGIEKTYVAEVTGRPDEAALRRLAEGVDLEDGPTAPARVRRLGPSTVELVIHEGRNRQVRRMLEAVGHPVRTLRRTAYGGVQLAGLEPGEWRPLTPGELQRLRDA